MLPPVRSRPPVRSSSAAGARPQAKPPENLGTLSRPSPLPITNLVQTRRGLPPDPVLAGLTALSLALVWWSLAGPGGARVSWAVQTGLDVLIAAGSWRLARQNTGRRHARRFWLAVLATGVCC